MSILKLEEIKSLQGTGNTVITFDTSDRAVFAQPPLTAVPAFRAYQSATISVTSGVATKVPANTKTFDTNNWYDTVNYRYLPLIAGYYQISGLVRVGGTGQSTQVAYLYKNGSQLTVGEVYRIGTNSSVNVGVSDIVYMNGSTDYVELFGLIFATSGAQIENGGSINNTSYFSGFLVRAGAA